MITINSLSYKKDNTDILRDINTKIYTGEIIGIIGESGSGKTSLLKIIAGVLKDYNGEILIKNKLLNSISLKEVEKHVSSLFTRYPNEIIDDTVFNFMLQSRKIYKKPFNPFSDLDLQVTEEYIRLMHLNPWRDKKILTLSEGILKRILLASVFIKNTDVLLFDNPTNNLDLNSCFLLQKAIIRYAANGNKIIIISSNDLNFIFNISDRLLVMSGGSIVSDVTPYEVDTDFINKYFKTEILLSKNIYNGKPGILQFADADG